MNQDYMYTSELPVGNLPNLYILADGMGGHNAGDYASRYTVETIVKSVQNSLETAPIAILRTAIRRANLAVLEKAETDIDLEGMGTTVVAATFTGSELCVANVGDSRLYIAGNDFRQITRDHSYVQEMVRRGELRPEVARTHPDRKEYEDGGGSFFDFSSAAAGGPCHYRGPVRAYGKIRRESDFPVD